MSLENKPPLCKKWEPSYSAFIRPFKKLLHLKGSISIVFHSELIIPKPAITILEKQGTISILVFCCHGAALVF